MSGLKKELKKYQSYTISESALKYKREVPKSVSTPCTDALDSDYASAAVTVAACFYYGGFAAPEGCLVLGGIMVAKAEYDYHICMQQYNQH